MNERAMQSYTCKNNLSFKQMNKRAFKHILCSYSCIRNAKFSTFPSATDNKDNSINLLEKLEKFAEVTSF